MGTNGPDQVQLMADMIKNELDLTTKNPHHGMQDVIARAKEGDEDAQEVLNVLSKTLAQALDLINDSRN